MNWRLTFLVLMGSVVWAEQCQITSPLPVPVLLSGCTYAGAFGASGYPLLSSGTFVAGTNVTITQSGSSITFASSGSGGGSGSSPLAVSIGVARSSPTSDIIAYEPFQGSVSGTSMTITLDPSSVTLQGNYYTFTAVATATNTLQTNINAVGTATGTIQTQLTNIATATGTIQTQLTSVASATGTLASSVASSTASLQGQVNDLVSPSTGVLAGAFPNTVIISSIAAQIQHNIAGLYLSTITVSASHTITSTDTVVFASAPVSSIIAATQYVYTLPYSSNAFNNGSGQVIQITKVDASTGPVKIQTQGGNLIDGTTGLLTLNAIGQTDELVADGNNGWWAHGQGIQITPSFLGPAQDGSGTTAMTTSSDTVICPFYVNVPIAVTGFRTFSITCTGASVGSDNFVVYDQLGNLRVSSNSVTCPGSAAWQVTLAAPVNLSPGQYYYGIQVNNATETIASTAANGGNGSTICSRQTSTTGTLPNPFTFGTTNLKSPAIFIQVAGGKTGI